jgi:linoleoyl-CoA desaturase
LWFFATYAVLVFVPLPPWGLALAIVSMGLATTASLTHIVHPLMHQSVARSRTANILAAHVLAPLGVSWRWWVVKHNVAHHGYPTVAGHDPDVDQGFMFRYDGSQPWRPWQRAQHIYAWFLYPFLTLRYILFSDLTFIFTGREKGRPVESPSAWRTGRLLVDKLAPAAVLLAPAFVLHPPIEVLAVVVAVLLVNGFSTVLVFVPNPFGDEMPATVPDEHGLIATDFAATTIHGVANVQVRNPIGRWYMGGLDHHVEHHLLGWLSHRDLPLIAPIVRDAALARGLPYRTHASIFEGWRGHHRRLRALGRRPELVSISPTVAPAD